MPDSNDFETLKLFVENSRPLIAKAVRIACRKYKHRATPDEIEDFSEDVIKLLLDKDCRRLQTHDPVKASFKTWLQHVVNHEVSRQLQKNYPAESLEDELLNLLSYPPTQDKEVLWKERQAILREAIKQLSQHDQRLALLKLEEVDSEEIAKEFNVKPASVEREWRVIKTKLKQIVTDGAQSKVKQSKAKQSKDMMRLGSFCKYCFEFAIRFLCPEAYKDNVKRKTTFSIELIYIEIGCCFSAEW